MYRVLAVDDEPKNLMLIEGYLDDANFEITTASDGVEAWDILKNSNIIFDLVLLDRMMPNMNGMELLKKIKSDSTLKTLPVIMQTAAAEKSQILEGVKAGVFHYLTKPYDEETLRAIVDACIKDNEDQKALRDEVTNRKRMMGLIRTCYIEFKSVEEANDVATYIATLFPDPQQVVMGISELLINAVEHGNLGITYEQKTELNNKKALSQEIQRLLILSENKNKLVRVTYDYKETGLVELNIKDEGKGFDWQKFMELSPERATDTHGRGIAMANAISFDKIEYKGCGNEVTCTISFGLS